MKKNPLGKVLFSANGYDLRQEIVVSEPEKKHGNPIQKPTGKFAVYAGKKQVIEPQRNLIKLKDTVRAMFTLPISDGYIAKSTFTTSGEVTGYDLIGPTGVNFGSFKGPESFDKMKTIVEGIIKRKQSYKPYWAKLEKQK